MISVGRIDRIPARTNNLTIRPKYPFAGEGASSPRNQPNQYSNLRQESSGGCVRGIDGGAYVGAQSRRAPWVRREGDPRNPRPAQERLQPGANGKSGVCDFGVMSRNLDWTAP